MERRPRESYETFEKRGKIIPTVQSETHDIHKVRKRLIHFFISLLLCSIELTYSQVAQARNMRIGIVA